MADRVEALSAVVLGRAASLDTVLLAALCLLLLTTLARLRGGQAGPEASGRLAIGLKHLQLAMLGFTLAHLYLGFSFSALIRDILASPDAEAARQVYERLRAEGPAVFTGLVARLRLVQGPFGPVFSTSAADPTAWLAPAAALGALAAMVRWRGQSMPRRVLSLLGAFCIVAANWAIGGTWAVHASCLSEPVFCKLLFGI
jgi:hypothetical protein